VATHRRTEASMSELAEQVVTIEQHIASVIEGKPEIIRLALLALLSEGHVLLEDVPGVGKTLLAKAIGRSIACSVRRVQFTPDLLPSDVTGVSVYNQEHGDFEFKPGAVFANIVLGDEINRAGPKTQSALLEAMEERTVTVDGHTYELATPFMVIATQNPIELEGTYPLPEAQRDRFMMRLSIGYPSADAELEMLEVHGRGDRLRELQPITDAQAVADMIDRCKDVHAAPALRRYVIDFVRATREHPDVELGASPRDLDRHAEELTSPFGAGALGFTAVEDIVRGDLRFLWDLRQILEQLRVLLHHAENGAGFEMIVDVVGAVDDVHFGEHTHHRVESQVVTG
jgi:MoxR-like ATPase